MEKITLLTFFEVLWRKITGCALPKNTISRLGFYKFNVRTPIDSRDVLGKITQSSLRFFAMVLLCFTGIVSWSQNMATRQTSSLKTAVAFTDATAYINKVSQPWTLYAQQNSIKQTFTTEATGISSEFRTVKPQTANLDQIRNGSGATSDTPDAFWVNGNAGASNAHYAEGYSIPYRMVMKNLTIGTHTLIIEWDIKHSGKNALDYITSYDNMDNPPESHVTTFGHIQETIDPAIGVYSPGTQPTDTELIPSPSSVGSPAPEMPTDSFNALPDIKKLMAIYNGTINSITYVSEGDLNAAQSATRLQITFSATDPTVVIAWGGHIAAEYDWGTGNGASEVSGSPYHTRLVSLDGAGGNQDRSLAASAVVIPPPACIIDPTVKSICVGESPTFSGPDGVSTYSWSISGTSATLTNADQRVVTVNDATVSPDSPYILTLVTTNVVGVTSTCTATLTVNQTAAPSVTYNSPDCDESTFSITLSGVIKGAKYTVLNKDGNPIVGITGLDTEELDETTYTGLNDDDEVTFSNIPAGSGYQVTASVSDCESSATSCGVPTPDRTTGAVAPIEAKTESAGFDAFPVPFKDQLTIKYKFDYKSDVKIEVFNAQGMSVLSKTDTNSYLDKEITLDLKASKRQEQVYLVKVTTNRGSTTKKVISSK